MKTQIVVDKAMRRIVCLAHSAGKHHDFKLFQTSKVRLRQQTEAVVDTGYLGLQNAHAKTSMPKKRSKHHPLTKQDKAANRAISKKRIACENVIAVLKRFKIIAGKYRNRRKRFGLRFSLIAAIYNKDLTQ